MFESVLGNIVGGSLGGSQNQWERFITQQQAWKREAYEARCRTQAGQTDDYEGVTIEGECEVIEDVKMIEEH